MTRPALAAALAASALLATAASAAAAPSAPVLNPVPTLTPFTSLTLSWSPSTFSPGSTDRLYRVVISDSGATQKRTATVAAPATSLTLGLTIGHTYGLSLIAQETQTLRIGTRIIRSIVSTPAPAGATVKVGLPQIVCRTPLPIDGPLPGGPSCTRPSARDLIGLPR